MKTKVYGGWLHLAKHPLATVHGQVRVIVRARSRAAVLRALRDYGQNGVTDGFIRNYWGESGNPDELLATKDSVGIPFATNGMRYNGEKFTAKPLVHPQIKP